MKTAAFFLLVLLSALNVHAEEKIEGAFGLKLGQEFTAQNKPADKLGYKDATECVPPQPNPAFGTYFVYLTPKSHRIYRIIGVATLTDEAAASKLLLRTGAFIQNKYGSGNATQLPTFQYVAHEGGKYAAARSVTVSAGASDGPYSNISPQEKLRCDVLYEDGDLASQVITERQLDTLKDFDATGL